MENQLPNRESVNCTPRKKLADISNLPQQPKQVNRAVKSNSVLLKDKVQIEDLQKDPFGASQENLALTKALADRNRIIELHTIELQKLRTDLQKVQEKNLQLAQANNQMLADLNSGKDKIKLLQHELDCKNCLLKARQFEEKAKSGACHFNPSEARDETNICEDAKESSHAGQSCNTRQRHQRRSRCNLSLISTSAESVQAEENVSKKRSCRRRQSASFRPDGAESCLDSLGMGDSKSSDLNECGEQLNEDHPVPLSQSMEKDHEEKNAARVGNRAQPRSSVGRPLRRAAEKVQSYKELPLNVKMRREARIISLYLISISATQPTYLEESARIPLRHFRPDLLP